MLHPDFNLKLFELVATLSGTESLKLTRITVVIRPFHSNPLLGTQMSVIAMFQQLWEGRPAANPSYVVIGRQCVNRRTCQHIPENLY